MTTYLFTFVCAALVALVVTPLLRMRAGAGALRNAARGEQALQKPRVGGLVIFAAFAAAPFLVALVSPDAARLVSPRWQEISGLLAAAFFIMLVGYVDDVSELDWPWKSGGQIAAAVVLYVLGFRIGDVSLPGGYALHLGLLDLPVSVFWVWLVMNAVNLSDGHDGVAAGVTALTAGAMALVAWNLDHLLIAVLFAALAGSVCGFLPFNFPNASRFLGDSGALLLGFLLAALSISGFIDETGRIPLYIPVVALAVPLLDIALAFSRRLLDGRHPFRGDLDHVHHRIERLLGYGPKRLALTLYAFSALFAAGAVALHLARGTVWFIVVAVLLTGLLAALALRLDYHRTFTQALLVRRLHGILNRRGRLLDAAGRGEPSMSSLSARPSRDE